MTVFHVIQHPIYRGMPYEDFEKLPEPICSYYETKKWKGYALYGAARKQYFNKVVREMK